MLGVRIAYAAAIVGAFGLAVLTGWEAGIRTAGVVPHASVVNYTLSVLPMFILIGYLAYYAGITQAAFEAARRWLGWLPGGLAIATVYRRRGLLGGVGRQHGGRRRVRQGGDPGDAEGEATTSGWPPAWCAAGATLDSLIPPSALLVVYGIITEQSIGKLLMAGFAPGIFSALRLHRDHLLTCWRNPELGKRDPRLHLAAALQVAARHARRSCW